MFAERVDLRTLTERVRRGDASAAERLRRELEPCVARIVSRALRAESEALPLTRYIRSAARRLAPAPSPSASPGRRAGVVTEAVCESVLNEVQGGLPRQDLRQTVVA
jgi:hypothetical protein